jgi:ATP/maltotriose-dependent transcriptional regulator MalT
MELLERSRELDVLNRALAAAADGHGSVVLITGDAGIGKTRLADEFVQSVSETARILWGACDDLDTPRVLGPFRDMAHQIGGELDAQLGSSDQKTEVFGAVLQALDVGPRPTVVMIEDAHWADATTIDVIKYLGRRVDRLRVLLIVTYRDAELEIGHRLRTAVGDLPVDSLVRLPLDTLSPEAVDRMARESDRDGSEVFAATGGNPFLTSELLAHPAELVPANVLDAIAGRVARLPEASRQVVALTAVVPGRCERRLLKVAADDLDAALEEGKAGALLEFDEEFVWFRHELVRRAVEESLSETERKELNSRIAANLVDAAGDPARIVHHAERAGDVAKLLEFAPAAARQARAVAAHREAVSHYRRVLPYLDELPPDVQAVLLMEYTSECYYVDDQPAALQAAEQALQLARQLGDVASEGEMLRWSSRIRWWLGDGQTALQLALEAIATLEAIEPTHQLAMAYSGLSQLYMLSHDTGPAITWAGKAIETATAVDDKAALAHALNNLGSARSRNGDAAGLDVLLESLELALAEGLDEHAGRAYANSIWICLEARQYSKAEELLANGLSFAIDREMHGDEHYMTAERAWLEFDRGDWAAAEQDARWVLGRQQAPGITTLPALITLARLQVRRGDADTATTIDEALTMAAATGEFQRIGPASLAKAEAAWLRGDLAGASEAVKSALNMATQTEHHPIHDELAQWAWRAGDLDPAFEMKFRPFVLQVAGDWAGAAAAWAELGCPYEQGVALLDADTAEPLREALDIFHGLGAVPAAAIARRQLRSIGVENVPRGPRPATRAHRGGLTRRQNEVLALITEDLTNAEIAERLFISAKTVDHHISAILTKLGVSSRREAARWAREHDEDL